MKSIAKETPRCARSGAASPTKSLSTRITNMPSSLSQLVGTLDYDSCGDDILDYIPEREWKLLAALARKREEDDERERLADQFRKLWQREKEERDKVEAEMSGQYKRYIHVKREQERTLQDYKRFQRVLEQQLKKGQLVNCIKYKERKAADLLATRDDLKASEIISKAIDEEARAQLAADRRSRINTADEWKRQLDLVDTERRAHDANRRRNAMLRDASQRVAISNALNTWESSMLRQELSALEAARRASHAARAARTAARSATLAKARERAQRRARKLAAVTARLRDAVRGERT